MRMPTPIPDEIEDYALAHTTQPGPLLEQLAAEAIEKTPSPGMMSGPAVGYFLNTLVHVSGARRVLEIGTFVGYSALMMAAALPEDGELITCDIDPQATAIARKYWARSEHGRKIELRLAPAAETMDDLTGSFDLVFIDADKGGYPQYFQKSLQLLSPRGLIVLDNMLRSGRVLDPQSDDDRTIVTLNEAIQADPRVQNVLLTVRDGLMVVRKA